MKQQFKAVYLVSLMLGCMSLAAADPGEITDDHKGHCFDSPESEFICERFIEGFLEGALLTDAAIIKTLEEQEQETLSFTDRAIKTRIGSRVDQPTELAGFCLPEGYTVHRIAQKILAKIDNPHVDSDILGRTTYEALKTHYSCE